MPFPEVVPRSTSSGGDLRTLGARSVAETHDARRYRRMLGETDALLVVARDTVLFADAGAAHIFDKTVDTLVGGPLTDAVFGAHRAPLGWWLSAPLDVRTGRFPTTEVRFSTTEGAQRAARFRQLPLEIDGQPARLVGIDDLTRRPQARAPRAIAQRMSRIGRLISGAAFEINHPLTHVVTSLHELIGHARGEITLAGDEMLELAETGLRGARNAARIIEELATYGRNVNGSLERVDVNGVVREVMRMAERAHPQPVRFSCDLGALPPGQGHKGRLAHVLLGLVTDGLDALGSVPDGQMPCIHVGTWSLSDVIGIRIRDNGRHRMPSPARLGAQLVEEMGGWIEFDRRLNLGAAATVFLPVHRARPGPRAPILPFRSVAVVEPRSNVAAAVRRVLGDRVELHPCADGHTALAAEADLIIWDADIPGGMRAWQRGSHRDRFLMLVDLPPVTELRGFPTRQLVFKPLVDDALSEVMRRIKV